MTTIRALVALAFILGTVARHVAGCSGIDPNPPDPHTHDPIVGDASNDADGGP